MTTGSLVSYQVFRHIDLQPYLIFLLLAHLIKRCSPLLCLYFVCLFLQDISGSLCFRGQSIFLHNACGWFGSIPLEASGDFGIHPEEGEFHLMCQVLIYVCVLVYISTYLLLVDSRFTNSGLGFALGLDLISSINSCIRLLYKCE